MSDLPPSKGIPRKGEKALAINNPPTRKKIMSNLIFLKEL